MRDVAGDAMTGVQTIPVIMGINKTTAFLTAINAIFGIIILFMSMNRIPLPVMGMIIIGIIYAQLYIISFRYNGNKTVICDIMADGQFIVMGGLFFLTLNF
jgi:4-hydroxybenzoate polyprenyltransferase